MSTSLLPHRHLPDNTAPLMARRCASGHPVCTPQPRLLVLPGLHGSGPDHWQSWLERRSRGSRRVEQGRWAHADLPTWTARVGEVLASEPPGPWIAVAHSFGCLALVQHLLNERSLPPTRDEGAVAQAGVVAALLVAPADPERFAARAALARRLPLREAAVLSSSNDPWLPTHAALPWAQTWGVRLIDLGDVGHVNVDAGFGPWAFMRDQVARLQQRWHSQRRAAAPQSQAAATAAN